MLIEKIMIITVFIHQTLDIVGVKKYVERPELVSPDTIGWLIYLVLMTLYLFSVPFINIVFILLFSLVLFGFYHFHWKHFLFGATEKKMKSYYDYFNGTHRLFPESTVRVVPDTFHMIHTLLYGIALVVLIFNLVGGWL